ncbi:hypothetical protein D5018_11985 [Parashewanella curva]|uniref:Uncharacterized protein n=1 Tax=Parashewanella curva TaxID=2338552 RepID=A0A3L8PVV7_9GAMM|nr:hypothetical protein [Parashewanella curva]RLV59500.1 hypothetical protein D5018_11985 [Parashewanella curva]
MATALTNLFLSSAQIESEYYHSILHYGVKKTHKSFWIHETNFSIRHCRQGNQTTLLQPIVEGFVSPPTSFQIFLSSEKTQRYRQFHATHDKDTLSRFTAVINSPAVRANASSFENFHLNHTDERACENTCCYTQVSIASIDVGPDSSVGELRDAFIQSLLIRGKQATHENFFCGNSQLAISMSQTTPDFYIVTVNQSLLPHHRQKVLTEKLASMLNNPDNQSCFNAAMLGREIELVKSQVAVQLPDELLSLLTQFDDTQEEQITLSFYDPIKKEDIEADTAPLHRHLEAIYRFEDDTPEYSLNALKALKDKIPPQQYQQLNLNQLETKLLKRVSEKESIPNLKEFVMSLRTTSYKDIESDKSCCVTGLDLHQEKNEDIIQIKMSNNTWNMVSKNNVMKLFDVTESARHPLTNKVLEADDFRAVPVNEYVTRSSA